MEFLKKMQNRKMRGRKEKSKIVKDKGVFVIKNAFKLYSALNIHKFT